MIFLFLNQVNSLGLWHFFQNWIRFDHLCIFALFKLLSFDILFIFDRRIVNYLVIYVLFSIRGHLDILILVSGCRPLSHVANAIHCLFLLPIDDLDLFHHEPMLLILLGSIFFGCGARLSCLQNWKKGISILCRANLDKVLFIVFWSVEDWLLALELVGATIEVYLPILGHPDLLL